MGEVTGAGHGERSPERLVQRNGYRDRDWQTRVGTVEQHIPKLRRGSYYPAFLGWATQRARHMTLETIGAVGDTAPVSLSAVPACSGRPTPPGSSLLHHATGHDLCMWIARLRVTLPGVDASISRIASLPSRLLG